MYSAKIENSSGEELTLTGKEPVYQIVDISGLDPPPAQINLTAIAGLDGAVFNSSKLQTRNLVLTVRINGGNSGVETNRLLLYNYFRTKERCVFYYKNGSLDVMIEGYVESVECGLFTKNELAQISIICPYPYFRSLTETVTDFSKNRSLFVFPFSINFDEPVVISELNTSSLTYINNDSEAETGAVILVEVIRAFNAVDIKNLTTGDDFELEYAFQPRDTVVINTGKGQKSVKLIRNGVIYNLFSALKRGSVFFQLVHGVNAIDYLTNGSSAENGSAAVTFRHYTVYRGV